MAISPQRLTIYLYSAHRAVIFAIAQLSCYYIDGDLGAATHVRRTVSRCFAALRLLSHIRRHVTNDCFRSLVVSFVHSGLDCGNFVFVGLPAYLQRRLQLACYSNFVAMTT